MVASGFKFLDLLLEMVELGLEEAFGGRQGEVLCGIDELGLDGHELIAQGVEFGEMALGRIWSQRGLWVDSGTIVRKDFGIEAIGFSQQAFGACEVANLARVEDRERDLRTVERFDQGTLVTAGGLDAEVGVGGKQRQERLKALRSIGQTQCAPWEGAIEMGF